MSLKTIALLLSLYTEFARIMLLHGGIKYKSHTETQQTSPLYILYNPAQKHTLKIWSGGGSEYATHIDQRYHQLLLLLLHVQ